MLRETTFLVGGFLTIGLGVALGAGLFWSGAGAAFADAWAASGMAVGLGAFFVYVARSEHRHRLAFLKSTEQERSDEPGVRSP